MFISARSSKRLAAALLLTLAGCTVGPDFLRPEAPPDAHYGKNGDPATTIAADSVAQRFAPGKAVAAEWWRLFNSPKIDAIIAAATAANPTLQAAQASLRQSQYNLRAGYGVFFPAVAADLGAARQRYSR